MYSTCISCNARLGTNHALESFPIGRRLAFDPAKGRLWVISPSCQRWNLTPLEERWEAIEEAERLFARTPLKLATENIGLARVAPRMALIRVGEASRPELAGWRYGRQIVGRRRAVHLVQGLALSAGIAGFLLQGPNLGLAAMTAMGFGVQVPLISAARSRQQTVLARISSTREVRVQNVYRASLVPSANGEWSLRLDYRYLYGQTWRPLELRSAEAMRALRLVLPWFNHEGASRRTVQEAAVRLSARGSDRAFVAHLASRAEAEKGAAACVIQELSEVNRLALEMAASEELEQQAAAGELAPLEAAWREAEDVAAIADDMFLPAFVRQFLKERQKG